MLLTFGEVILVEDIKSFLALSIPSIEMFGMLHTFDVDHITAIDNFGDYTMLKEI